MQVLGHRGSRQPGPENTVDAVRAAVAAGAAGVEVDVRRSRDGRLVCVHDPLLSAASAARADRRVVVETDAGELADLGVPLIADVLDAGAGSRVVLEIKNHRRQPDYDGRRGTSARLLMDLLDRRDTDGAEDDVVVSSFDPAAIAVARDRGRSSALLTLPGIPVVAGLRAVVRFGHVELHAHTSALPVRMPRRVASAVARVHEAGIRLVVWTVTSNEEARRLRDAGVDAVICDDPAGVVAALAS